MKFSLNWLNKYVDLSGLSPKQISDRLTFAGIEVEGFYPLAFGDRLVIGQILEVKNHPDSDHLHVLNVNLGQSTDFVKLSAERRMLKRDSRSSWP